MSLRGVAVVVVSVVVRDGIVRWVALWRVCVGVIRVVKSLL